MKLNQLIKKIITEDRPPSIETEVWFDFKQEKVKNSYFDDVRWLNCDYEDISDTEIKLYGRYKDVTEDIYIFGLGITKYITKALDNGVDITKIAKRRW